MNNQAMTRDEDMVKFSKSKDKKDKGFLIERNDKLPFAVLFKRDKINQTLFFLVLR
jgi:hypothetical protein